MAEVKSVVETNKANKVLSSYPLPCKESLYIDEIELSAAAIADIAVMCVLPKGFIPTDGKVIADALGSSVTLAVGTRVGSTDDADALASATSMNVAGKELDLAFGSLGMTALENPTQIIITVGGAAATGTVVLKVRGYATMS